MPTTKAITSIFQDEGLDLSVRLFKQHLRLEADNMDEDDLLKFYLLAGWGKAEKYCNCFWGTRTVETTFTTTERYELPAGSGEPISVRGFITDVTGLPTVGDYWVEYIKGSIINRECPLDNWNPPTYTVIHLIENRADHDVTMAVFKIAADLYENRETSTTGALNRPLAFGFQLLLNPYRVIN